MKFSKQFFDAFGGDEPAATPDLDEEFPLGDGTAATDAVVICPYCGESVGIAIDPGSGDDQDYVEDCEVCCQPWQVSVRYDRRGGAAVSIAPLDQ